MSRYRNKRRKAARGGAGLLSGAGLLLSAAAGWLAYSAYGVNHNLPLPVALEAERKSLSSQKWNLNYYVKGEGQPLVLLHSINAAGSAYEVKPLFDYYARNRKVYALEWPGFGFSDRLDIEYTPLNFTHALLDFMTEVIQQPADVVALSLAGEFAARTATLRPELFRHLALLSPSGFSAKVPIDDFTYAPSGSDQVLRLLQNPLWSQAFYDLLGTHSSINFYLQMTFNGPVDPGLAEYDYATSHQPGARHAPIYFVAGKLFSRDIQHIYNSLAQPVLVLYGEDDPFVTFERLDRFRTRPNWQVLSYRGKAGLMHFDNLQEATRRLDAFWKTPEREINTQATAPK